MNANKLLLLLFILGLVMSLTVIIACGDDDDDDDDDDDGDDDDDDDDNGGGDIVGDCIEFYMDCYDVDQSTAELSCSWLENYDVNECVEDAFSDYLDCIGCGNYDPDLIQACVTQFLDDIVDCY